MLTLVDIGPRSLERYRAPAPPGLLEAVWEAAAPLRGARVLHLNATPYGGGVSELLRSIVPLLRDLGIVAHWRIISGDETFFRVTKAMHNGLQGATHDLTPEQERAWRETAEANARAFEECYDFVFVHDPQPAGLLAFGGARGARWVWRCHIDTSSPNPSIWRFLSPYLAHYDAAIFTMAAFVPPSFPIARVEIVPPAIDPLSPKNLALVPSTAREVLDWIGVRTDRPLVTQVSRFDPWKDPLGVLAAYRAARREVPDLQLALVGSMALDDPEGADIYRQLLDVTRDDPLVHVFTNLVGVGNIEVNAFQMLSDVVVQKSIREGFGLVVSESLWKGTPVVAGRAGGIPLQMADGVGGVLVDSVDECAEALVGLLRDPERRRALGASGRERVREHFLTPRLLLNELLLLRSLLEQRPLNRPPGWAEHRDPVCGMVLEATQVLSLVAGGRTWEFCSERCRAVFREDPEPYLREGRARLAPA